MIGLFCHIHRSLLPYDRSLLPQTQVEKARHAAQDALGQLLALNNTLSDLQVGGCVLLLLNVFSYYRICSHTTEYVLILQNVFSYYRMCSLTMLLALNNLLSDLQVRESALLL